MVSTHFVINVRYYSRIIKSDTRIVSTIVSITSGVIFEQFLELLVITHSKVFIVNLTGFIIGTKSNFHKTL